MPGLLPALQEQSTTKTPAAANLLSFVIEASNQKIERLARSRDAPSTHLKAVNAESLNTRAGTAIP